MTNIIVDQNIRHDTHTQNDTSLLQINVEKKNLSRFSWTTLCEMNTEN